MIVLILDDIICSTVLILPRTTGGRALTLATAGSYDAFVLLQTTLAVALTSTHTTHDPGELTQIVFLVGN